MFIFKPNIVYIWITLSLLNSIERWTVSYNKKAMYKKIQATKSIVIRPSKIVLNRPKPDSTQWYGLQPASHIFPIH